MIWLLGLYPRDWRRRYGAEIEEIVAAQPASLQLAIDLIGGAVDAHLKPQAFARRLEEHATGREGGSDMLDRLKGCTGPDSMSVKDGMTAAALAIAIGLVFAGILTAVRSQAAEAVALATFPAFLALPSQWIFTRGHSRLARTVLVAGPILVCFLIGLAAAWFVSD